ncbi:MAG: hypothetical protein ABJC09_12435 [Terriglobia bacterium]
MENRSVRDHLSAAVRQYTSVAMTEFNAAIDDAPGVAYASYAGVIDRAHAGFPWRPPAMDSSSEPSVKSS